MCDLQKKVFNEKSLCDSYYEIRKRVQFKEKVQRYGIDLMENVGKDLSAYESGGIDAIKFHPFEEFDISERGKVRHIMSVDFRDRVSVHAFCQNILIQNLRKYLIYDNCASLEGRGIDMQRERLKVHLLRYYRKHHTNKGYVLIGDFSKFFDNLDHELLIQSIGKHIDSESLDFYKKILRQFRVDVSYMTDKEFEECKDKVFNSLAYYRAVPKSKRTGKRYLDRSMGIGSEASQISGVYYPTPIDNYAKIVRRCKYYGRYMDDFYAISDSKAYLMELLEGIKEASKALKLHLNMKKTRIVRLDRQFTFLKIRYRLTESGAVVMRHTSDTFHRERRKLKKLHKKMIDGVIPYKDIENQFRSWRGNARKYKNYKALQSLDGFYNALFIEPFIQGRET